MIPFSAWHVTKNTNLADSAMFKKYNMIPKPQISHSPYERLPVNYSNQEAG